MDNILYKKRGLSSQKALPTGIVKNEYSCLVEYRKISNNKLHRLDGPALIERKENGAVKYEKWYKDGLLHREGAPALTEYVSGPITILKWYYEGRLHREDGPAVIDADGQELWYKDGFCVK